jgi:hypothetical protein
MQDVDNVRLQHPQINQRGKVDEGNRIREDIPHGPDTQKLSARVCSHTGAVPRRSRVGSRVQRITTLKSES